MREYFLMFCTTIWAGGTIISWICSGIWAAAGEIGIFTALSAFNTLSIQTGGGWGIMKQAMDFFEGIATMFLWAYPFLSSPWAIFLKIPLWIISIGAIWGIIKVMIGAVQSLVSAVRTLIMPIG